MKDKSEINYLPCQQLESDDEDGKELHEVLLLRPC